jgi:hypothetical protein
MNASTLLPFPPTMVSWITDTPPGVEWTPHTIGGDEVLVGAQRYDARLNGLRILTKMDDSYLRTIGNFCWLIWLSPTDVLLCIERYFVCDPSLLSVPCCYSRPLVLTARCVPYSCCTVTPRWIYPS